MFHKKKKKKKEAPVPSYRRDRTLLRQFSFPRGPLLEGPEALFQSTVLKLFPTLSIGFQFGKGGKHNWKTRFETVRSENYYIAVCNLLWHRWMKGEFKEYGCFAGRPQRERLFGMGSARPHSGRAKHGKWMVYLLRKTEQRWSDRRQKQNIDVRPTATTLRFPATNVVTATL